MVNNNRPVFDYAASGRPMVITDTIQSVIDEASEQQRDVGHVIEQFEAAEADEFCNNPEYQEKIKDGYRESGVNLASITVGTEKGAGFFTLPRTQARIDSAEWLEKITSPEKAREVVAEDNVGFIFNTQNLGDEIGTDLDAVNELYNAGYRIFQLTYNNHNSLGAGCTDRSNARLSDFGIKVVERLNELGGIVDLSHSGTETTKDAIEISNDPVAFTHAACKSLSDHYRNKTDEEIKALAENNGYMGIVAVPPFCAVDEENPSLDKFFDHLEHAISILGIDRVGLSTDFGNIDAKVPEKHLEEYQIMAHRRGFPKDHGKNFHGEGFGEFKTYTDFSVIIKGLEDRYTEQEVNKILGENFLSFWERVNE